MQPTWPLDPWTLEPDIFPTWEPEPQIDICPPNPWELQPDPLIDICPPNPWGPAPELPFEPLIDLVDPTMYMNEY